MVLLAQFHNNQAHLQLQLRQLLQTSTQLEDGAALA
jgi:hypothetical protein